MNGSFRHEPLPVFGDRLANINSWWERCQTTDATGILITSWEANRLSLETTTIVDAAAASRWLEPTADDATTMLSRGLERCFKINHSRVLARSLLAADSHTFAGYARWQINDRWDVFAGNESVKPYQAEARFFHREHARALREKWPAAITASFAFRHYIAQRDVFVRQAARAVFMWRRLLAKGAMDRLVTSLRAAATVAAAFADTMPSANRAARVMWNQTRDKQKPGPNTALLAADRERLAQWRQWLKAVTKKPALLREATPVCGAWQLQFMVHNFAPASQKVSVEQQSADGKWRELASRHTIEFRAQAARPHCKLKREFTVPIDSPQASLRIAVRGVGQVAISHVALTNGVQTHRAIGYHQKTISGRPAPQQGFPDITAEPAANSILPVRVVEGT